MNAMPWRTPIAAAQAVVDERDELTRCFCALSSPYPSYTFI